MKIVIDIGHGGKDSGAVHANDITYQYIKEKDIVLRISKILSNKLKNKYDVMVTRHSDIFLTLNERTEFANRNEADIFISLHANAFKNEDVDGVETLYNPDSKESKKLADYVHSELIKEVITNDRGIKSRDNLYVLNPRNINIPAILIEFGFITNPIENCLLQLDYYLDKLCDGVVRGIDNYKKEVFNEET